MKLNFQKKFELKIHKKYMVDFGIYSLLSSNFIKLLFLNQRN